MENDRIEFGCIRSNLEDYMTTSIRINGMDLRRIIEEIELPQLVKRGIDMQRVGYEGISFFIAFHNQDHFLCRTLSDYVYEDKRYALYDSRNSGIPGEYSLTCKIKMEENTVSWYDFKNFSEILPFDMSYRDLAFHFSLDQYCDAIDSIRNNKSENMFA